MREIKFRAWDLERKKMIHFANQGICSEYNLLTFDVQEKEEREYFGCLPDNEIILMQFSGLRDKNGKEIYEGDIVEDDGVVGADKNVIIPELPRLFHLYGEHVFVPDEVQVIGNIHENPDLLA